MSRSAEHIAAYAAGLAPFCGFLIMILCFGAVSHEVGAYLLAMLLFMPAALWPRDERLPCDVDVCFSLPNDGGRRTPPEDNYSPSITFDSVYVGVTPEWSVVLRFRNAVVLGENVQARMGFLSPTAPAKELYAGRTFSLWEGDRRVACGTIVRT